jgi:flagellar biosynthesis protein
MDKNNIIKKAVSMLYNQEGNNSPTITAKGKGEVANNIIKIATQNDIPIKQDQDLVNMLMELELNKEIPTELYQAVAEVFSYIYNLTQDKIDE